MFKFLWNYVKGYVIISIVGFSIERFLNICINDDINIFKISESGTGVTCRVSIKDFKKLKKIARKTGCKYKIIHKYGMPFFIFKNRYRKTFAISIFVFVALLYYFSSFIWVIEVKGNKFVDNNHILQFCKQNNLYLGVKKRKIDTLKLQNEIKNQFEDISFINVKINGTKATITISEKLQIKNMVENNKPCDIIAKEDGIINSIVTRTGRPIVLENDEVKKGDVLVSGEVFLKEGEEIKGVYYTYADADIIAKTNKTIKVEVPFTYNKKVYTNKKKSFYSLKFFDKSFSLSIFKPNINYTNYDVFTKRKQLKLAKNFYLPFIIKKTEYREYFFKQQKYSNEEAKSIANKLINEKINREINFSSDILHNEIHYENLQNKLIATAKITLLENIVEKAPITFSYRDERSIEDGTNKTSNSE